MDDLKKAEEISKQKGNVDRNVEPERGLLYALSGNISEALKVITNLNSASYYISPFEIAEIYAALEYAAFKADAASLKLSPNQRSRTKYVALRQTFSDQTFVWLDKAVTENSDKLALLKVDPVFDRFRQHPRFIKLLKDVVKLDS